MFDSGYLSTSLDCCHWMVKRRRWITSGSSVLLGVSRRPAGSPSLGHSRPVSGCCSWRTAGSSVVLREGAG
ncbi:hypothetical protein CesoFtcFv8_007778 [Champsocephalus esox]|uniref:Uncharacterized protein n=1 Tax=Champsocephalus esox TaxID=159716 RepID=A0AAN8CF17_9TELE|nr:hypothetical protein CesoFtcFv8_007778 [Champsocephalus esox]